MKGEGRDMLGAEPDMGAVALLYHHSLLDPQVVK